MARAPRKSYGSDTAAKPHDDIRKIALKRFDAAWEGDRKNREDALEDLQFLVGDQWDAELKEEREGDGRPCATENRLPQFVDQIVGDIRQQTPAAKARPVDDDADPKTAEVITSLLRDIEGRSMNMQPYVKAAEAAVQGGIGHWRILTRYSRIGGFEQEIYEEPIPNPFAVVWDPLSRAVTRSDARFCFVTERMDRDDFKAQWPNATCIDFDQGDLPETYDAVRNWYDADTVRVAEYWYKEPIKRRYARLKAPLGVPGAKITPAGAIIELQAGEQPPEGAEVREIADVKVCMVKMSGLEVLEEPVEWLTRDIPIIPVVGKEIMVGDKVVRHGAIRFAKDPQWRYNVWLSTITELIGLQPKAPHLATPEMLKGHEKQWKLAHKKNFPVLLYNPDPKTPGARPTREPPPQGSEAIVRLMLMAEDAMKATTGQYAASLGQPSDETSGRAINARVAQANTIAFVYSDNLTASVRHAGQIKLDLIPKIYDTERVVRLLNEDGSEAFERVNVPYTVTDPETGMPVQKTKFDLTVGRYDLIISTGPAYATKRAEAAQAMMEFIRYAPDAAKLVLDLIAKNMDWPGADEFAERFQKALPPELRPKKEEPDEEDMARAAAAEQEGQVRQFMTAAAMRKEGAQADEAEAKAEKAKFEAFEQQLQFQIESGALDDVIRRLVQAALAGSQPPPMEPGAPMAA
jgi:hypothetical protein